MIHSVAYFVAKGVLMIKTPNDTTSAEAARQHCNHNGITCISMKLTSQGEMTIHYADISPNTQGLNLFS